MDKTDPHLQRRNRMIRSMGLLIAPLIFSAIICAVGWLIINASIDGITGYIHILLMEPAEHDYPVSDLLPEIEAVQPAAEIVDISQVTFPAYEQVYGELSIPSIGLLCPFVYGDTERAIKKGVGQYIGSTIVGYGGTTMACAHVNRQFKNLHKTEIGDQIQIRTAYGVYAYEVKYAGVHDAQDDSVYDLSREDENLVLYTCYYQNTPLGSVKKRFFVCADYISGPMIVDRRNG